MSSLSFSNPLSHFNGISRFPYTAVLLLAACFVLSGCAPQSTGKAKKASADVGQKPQTSSEEKSSSPKAPEKDATSKPESADSAKPAEITSAKDAPANGEDSPKAPLEKPEPPTPPKKEDPPSDSASSTGAQTPLTTQQAVDKVKNAVVFITTRDSLGSETGLGSGFVINDAGWVVTNYHVIRQAASAKAKFRDGAEFEIEGYRALDKDHDLAILQLKTWPEKLAPLPLADPPELKQGQAVLAIGHPAGFEFTASNGIISALRKTSELPRGIRETFKADENATWIQVTAPISPGSSGGPLLTSTGQLIGVSSWIAVRGQNLGFAVHARHLLDLHKKLAAKSDQNQKVQPLPVPGSLAGPSIRDKAVLSQLAQFRRDLEDFQAELRQTPPNGQIELFRTKHPTPKHIPKFRKLAEEHPDSETEFESLIALCRLMRTGVGRFLPEDQIEGAKQARQDFQFALQRLADHYVDRESLGAMTMELSSIFHEEVRQFQRTVLEKSDHPKAKGLALVALGTSLYSDPKTRGRSEEEAIALLERAVTEFHDVKVGDSTLKEQFEPLLVQVKHLSIGKTVPSLEGKNTGGQPLKLEDHRGKVVLLAFWADWDGISRRMYAGLRVMQKKYQDRNFALLGVNADEPEELKKVLENNTVTWPNWPDGRDGPIAKRWSVRQTPMFYLIDHHGVVRSKGRARPEQIAESVDLLMTELELKLPMNLIPPCSTWTYLSGKEPPKNWRQADFDDSSWNLGRSPLGFGQGDEATPILPVLDLKSPTRTYYFRTTFEASGVDKTQNLLLGASVNDGVVIYLNGREVLRDNLDIFADHNDYAGSRASDGGRERSYFVIDPKLLVDGKNVLAAEVHQARDGLRNLRLDLTLSSDVRQGVIQAAGDPDSIAQQASLLILGELGPAASQALPQVTKAIKSHDLLTRHLAAATALHLSPPEKWSQIQLPEVKEDEEDPDRRMRRTIAMENNNRAWIMASRADRSPFDYSQGIRLVKVATHLAPEAGAILNTLGVVYYRAGEYQKAIEALEKASQNHDENPFDSTFIAMAHHQLKNADKAKEYLDKAAKIFQQQKWKNDSEAKAFMKEAKQAITGE